MGVGRRWVAAGLVLVFLLAVWTCSTGVLGEIHRARTVGARVKVTPRVFPPGPNPDRDYEPPMSRDVFIGGGAHSRETWLYSILSAIMVGLSGIFPLLVIPMETGQALRRGKGARHLQLLLSFAVGGLIGDVFLHLLPEAWAHLPKGGADEEMQKLGLWVLAGLLSFLIIEKLFAGPGEHSKSQDEDEPEKKTVTSSTTTASTTAKNNGVHTHAVNGKLTTAKKRNKSHKASNGIANGSANGIANGSAVHSIMSNGVTSHGKSKSDAALPANKSQPETHIKVTGWLNLMANVIDNFTHGLAVAASYCVSTKVGVVTTMAILLHEIPHEVGDFAILLRSGFDRWKAAKAQMLTATGGLVGALVALSAESTQEAGERTAWILPFTSGGFLYIALVTVLPDLMKENNPKESLKQVSLILAGVLIMSLVFLVVD